MKINLIRRMKIPTSVSGISGIIITFFLIQLFFSCTGPGKQKSNDNPESGIARPVLVKPPSSFSDTLIITSSSAVFYSPDSVQLQKIKSVNKKMTFESMTHDCFYQMKNARTVLKRSWQQIQIIETSQVRYLIFVKTDKSKIAIDLNTKNDICGILIFNQKKDPELVDMTNIDTALEFYFNH